jgi:hypothetical protein
MLGPIATLGLLAGATVLSDDSSELTSRLTEEVRTQGWIIYSARSEAGDWDLFRMRPDGSDRKALTQTRDYHEAGVRFSPDGKRILYYRIPRGQPVDNNTYGTYELVIADADGSHATIYGREFPWASWGPEGTRLACLRKEGIAIIDVESRRVLRQVPRRKIVQQLAWSPDGRSFAGTANGLGPYWNIGRLDDRSGQIVAVSETERYNCTPDWMPDSRGILYSRGITPEAGGWAELWLAGAGSMPSRSGTSTAVALRPTAGICCSPAVRSTSVGSTTPAPGWPSSAWRIRPWSEATTVRRAPGIPRPAAGRSSTFPGDGSRTGRMPQSPVASEGGPRQHHRVFVRSGAMFP